MKDTHLNKYTNAYKYIHGHGGMDVVWAGDTVSHGGRQHLEEEACRKVEEGGEALGGMEEQWMMEDSLKV